MPSGNPSIPESQRNVVDLRSDTVTRPTPEMYEAMMNAPLGDDVYSDDPTVNELEVLAAKMTGKEAALFVPSGTMGNQIAIACHTQPGDSIIVEEDAHIIYYEAGAPAVLAQVVTWTLRSNRGVMDPADIERHILKRDLHSPGTAVLCVENTHNRAGGTIVPQEYMAAYASLCASRGLKFHLDGARVFNAAAGLGVPVSEITQYVDSVSFCLSKALRSPVGSLLCGPSEFIDRARLWRKRLGGGMRQAGILAACGIVSLTSMVDRLADDHRRARSFASAISELPGVHVNWDTVQTNMVMIGTDAPAVAWTAGLREHGIWASAFGVNMVRFVFHADIDDAKLERAIEGFKKVSASLLAVR
jgi:threonine aldolase